MLWREAYRGVLGESAFCVSPLIFSRRSERFEPEGNDESFMRSFGYVVDVHNVRNPGMKRYISREDADKYRRDAASRRTDTAERLERERQYAEEERERRLQQQQQEENYSSPVPRSRGPSMGR